MSNNIHIVQLSYDTDAFDPDAPQDSQMRQIAYAKFLDEKCPGALLTNIILTSDSAFKMKEFGNLTLDPRNFYRLRHLFKLFRYLRKLHKQSPITVLTTQDFHGIFWAGLAFGRISKVPVVGQHHCDLSSQYSRENRFTKPYGRAYESFALHLVKAFDGLRVVNSKAKKYLHSIGCNQSIEVLPVPSVTFAIDKNKCAQHKRDKNTLRVLFAGRFVKFKNLECWIRTASEALKSSVHLDFYLIGDGAERKYLENLSDELNLHEHVHFLGALPPEQLAKWYSNADVFLLTSKYEGFGRVIVEAMNYGMVPVCTNVSGPQDIIQHGVNGYLAEADPKALSSFLVELANDENKLVAMSNHAIDTVKNKYSTDKLREDWMNFLLSFIPSSEYKRFCEIKHD